MGDRMGARVLGAAFTAATLCLSVGGVCVGADAIAGTAAPTQRTKEPGLQVPALAWAPCAAYECASATVPLDYDHPSGATTQLALARIPATDQAHRVGTVFINPGGPGASGIEFLEGGFGAFLSSALQGRFDIVGFDPRGVGASDPLHCFASEDALFDFFSGVPVFPYRESQYRPFFDRYRSLADECHDDGQAIVDHMSTADVARDLDLLRRAVGDQRLSFVGLSYGSFIGNTYASLFPNKIRAMVIDGVLDPRLWSTGRQIEADEVATRQEFSEFLRLCDAAKSQCDFWEPGGSRDRWERLAAAVRDDPPLIDNVPYTYDFLVTDAVSAMYVPADWPEFATYFDRIADTALAPQPAVGAANAALLQLMHKLARAEADYPNGFDSMFGNQCADTQYPHSFSDYRSVGKAAAKASRFGPFWWWLNSACADWPVNADRFTGPWRTHTSAPVLVVGNYFDGITPYTGAQASASLLEGSRLLSYAGWGHTGLRNSTCVRQYVVSYLLDLVLPPKGQVCPAVPNPFLPVVAKAPAIGSVLASMSPPAMPPYR